MHLDQRVEEDDEEGRRTSKLYGFVKLVQMNSPFKGKILCSIGEMFSNHVSNRWVINMYTLPPIRIGG